MTSTLRKALLGALMLGLLTAVVALPASADNGWISGTVYQKTLLFGDPLSGATVTTDTGGYSAQTNATGAYNISVAPGNYTLKVTASGWVDATSSQLTVTANNTTRKDFALVKPTGNLTGTITDADDGTPISMVTIKYNDGTILPPSTFTDTSGKYALKGLPVGTLNINVTPLLGYPETSFSVTITAGQNTTKDVQLKMPTTVTVAVGGGVLGLPISGATVTVGSVSGTTDALGMVTLTVTPGNYTLTVKASGYQTAKKDITVTKGDNTYQATLSKPGGNVDTGLMALLFGALCLILFLPLLIIIIVIVVVIILLRRKKKAKAAEAAAMPAPPAPGQQAPQPGGTGVPPPPGQGPPAPPPNP